MRPLHTKLAIFLLIGLFAGCTSSQTKESRDRENSHLRWIVKLYLHASQGHAPKNEREFKQFISGIDPAIRDRTLAAAEVKSMDELFISERDGLPYVILYSPPPKGVASGVIAYEQQGTEGERYIGYTKGIIEKVDEQQFDTLVPKAARSMK